MRDYIHVMDVAEGHCVALEHLWDEGGTRTFNLGTGVGASVLQLIAAFDAASGRDVPYRIAARRPRRCRHPRRRPDRGGLGLLDHQARLTDMCPDAWHFQTRNPVGHAS